MENGIEMGILRNREGSYALKITMNLGGVKGWVVFEPEQLAQFIDALWELQLNMMTAEKMRQYFVHDEEMPVEDAARKVEIIMGFPPQSIVREEKNDA